MATEDIKYTLKVDPEAIGKRLDKFISERFSGQFSRTFVKRLISDGVVRVNDLPKKACYKLKEGDVIKIYQIHKTEELPPKAEDIPLQIIYEDQHLLVVNKPAGMAVHPSCGITKGTLVNALLYHCKLSDEAGSQRAGIVHRLDKDTSGLIVVAKDNQSHRNLARQFKERKITKRYIAFVRGDIELDTGIIDVPIGRHPSHRQKQAVRFVGSKEALTKYKVLRRFGDYTMVELEPLTGRMHQIRVHMSYIGHPVLGDKTYSKSDGRISRQALHSSTLIFRHPVTGQKMEFHSDIPDDMKRLLKSK